MYHFFDLQLHYHPVKVTNSRSTMQVLAFFGAVGGMQRFVGKFFGQLGGYFSGKFFGAKLASDLYIMKKNKKAKSKKTTKAGITENGMASKVLPQNKLLVGEDFNKGQLFERFKITTWQMFLDHYVAKFPSCTRKIRDSKDRMKLLLTSGKRVKQEFNVMKLL